MKLSAITLLGLGLCATGLSVAHAATWTPFAVTAGAQCAPIDINDSGITVGNCTPASTTANDIPWVAVGSGSQIALPPLATGQPCRVWAVSNTGKVVGDCRDASNSHFGTTWEATSPSTAPTKLNPLPSTWLIPLLRPQDVATEGVAINDQGDVAGSSYNADSRGTVVFYATGSSTPERVSDWGDNCTVADLNLPATGTPQIALNCPNNAGNTTARVAEKTGSFYTLTNLPLPPGATNCIVNSATKASSFVGTCLYPNSAVNVAKSAFWSSKTATPLVLTLSSGSKNMVININEIGQVLVSQNTADGRNQYMTWLPSTLPIPIITFILFPSGSVWGEAGAIVGGNVVGLNILTNDQYSLGCTWTQTTGSVCLPSIGGGKNNRVTAISKNGAHMAGVVMDATQTAIAVTATLP
ncbi:hypothetical protein PFLUOLIPICF7_09355 [Pseudomonas simiae]|jgi:hypothetical protein|uniref:hypothetical protein n=1 Tax=Pseudomonas simiae TaxID=321846 RepID=UPI0005D89351|nr:hypothetical protein [Pseudomonas simiae]AJZ97037.1 hypothetical protein PFLUOLIPICF7_09355 [Pseudomonas simiae]